MKVAHCRLKSVTPYSQSKFVDPTDGPGKKMPKELPADWERRVWQEKLHYDDKGHVYIPPMAFKNCLAESAKYLAMQIPGKGKSTYTKHFEAGILCLQSLDLGMKKTDVGSESLMVPSDGVAGSGKRVMKIFPIIHKWEGVVEFNILDSIITSDIFFRHLASAGSLIGIGRFRPRNRGFYGRFEVLEMKWDGKKIDFLKWLAGD